MITCRHSVASVYCHYAFGELTKTEVANCVASIVSNSHVNLGAMKTVKENMDWQSLLSGQ